MAPIIMGVAAFIFSLPAPIAATTMAVKVDELCTIMDPQRPNIIIKGIFTFPLEVSHSFEDPDPKSLNDDDKRSKAQTKK